MGVLRKIRCEKKLEEGSSDMPTYRDRKDIHTGRILRGRTRRSTSQRIPSFEDDTRDDQDISGAELPEDYWKSNVGFSSGKRDLIAEGFFCHIWRTQGKSVALGLLENYETLNLHNAAGEHFSRGRQLWNQEDFEKAGIELERAKRIRDLESKHHSLVHARYLAQYKNEKDKCLVTNPVDQDDEILEVVNCYANIERSSMKEALSRDEPFERHPTVFRAKTLSESPSEASAQLYFALGMVRFAEKDYGEALVEFRRAIQVSALGLGVAHDLTKASGHMIQNVLFSMGWKAYKIRSYFNRLKSDIYHEIEGDVMFDSGRADEALLEYACLEFLNDGDAQTQARIRTKIAAVMEASGDTAGAMAWWMDLLVLYKDTPSLGLDHPLAREVIETLVKGRRAQMKQHLGIQKWK